MTTAILDTNVIVQAVISSPPSASAHVLDAYYERRFRLVTAPPLLEELADVLLIPRIRELHGFSDEEIVELTASLLVYADSYTPTERIPADVTRDATDVKFLTLAQVSSADYLVTNDRRHLIRLGRFGRTSIVTPARFLRELPKE